MRRRQRHSLDPWPAVADCFLGILAIVALMAFGVRPDPRVQALKEKIKGLESRHANIVSSVDVDTGRATIVFTADSLSFEKCSSELSSSKQEGIRTVFEELGGMETDLFRLIKIEGHADKSWLQQGCRDLKPFADNLQLSQDRARAVFNALLDLDRTMTDALQRLDATQIPTHPSLQYIRRLYRDGHLQVAGFGAQKLREPSIPTAPINRRVEVVIEFSEGSTGRNQGLENHAPIGPNEALQGK